MGSMIQGQALGGIFASATNVLTLWLGATAESSAFYCFLVTVVFLASAFVAYIMLTRTAFYRFYMHGPPGLGQGEGTSEVTGGAVDILGVVRQIWVWILAVFVSFLVTLSVFPAVASRTLSTKFGDVSLV